MLYEKQYMETLEKICHGYWNTETSSNINENKQTVKVIESLRSTYNDNDTIITIPTLYFAFWNEYCLADIDINITIRELAEILCPIDFIICSYTDYNNKVRYAMAQLSPKLPLSSIIWTTTSENNGYNVCTYISTKNVNLHAPIHRIPSTIETVVFKRVRFVAYLHWYARRNAMLVAYKYKHGTFFHTLKWMALFL